MQFTDNQDHKWSILLDPFLLQQVRDTFAIDLTAPDANAMDKLYLDPCLLVNVLWILCREQAQQERISDREFGQRLVGDPIDDATRALTEALAAFFPQKRRSLLLSMLRTTQQVRDKGIELAEAKIKDPELMRKAQERMEKEMEERLKKVLTSSDTVSSSPESSESAPED